MRGKVLNFFEIQGQGFIHTDDGQKFQFNMTNWQASQPPQVGDEVEFSLDNNQQAVNIVHANQAINSGFQQSNQNINSQPKSNAFLNSDGNVGNDRVNMAGFENFGNQQSQQHPYNPNAQTQYNQNTQQPSLLDNVYSTPTSHIIPDNDGSISALYAEEENYNMIDWVKKCLQNYTNINGRARRKEYWYFILGQVVIGFVVGFILGLIGAMINVDLSIVMKGLNFFFIAPTLAVGIRRLHDIGYSGWWISLKFLVAIGIVASIFMAMAGVFGAGSWFIVWAIVIAIFSIIGGIGIVVLLTRDTSPETNQWGEPARDVNF